MLLSHPWVLHRDAQLEYLPPLPCDFVLWFISDSGSRWRGDNGWGDTDGWERGRYPQMCWLSAEIESGPCQSWSYQPRHSYSWLGPTFNNESNNRLLWLNCAPSEAHHKYQGWSLISSDREEQENSGNKDWARPAKIQLDFWARIMRHSRALATAASQGYCHYSDGKIIITPSFKLTNNPKLRRISCKCEQYHRPRGLHGCVRSVLTWLKPSKGLLTNWLGVIHANFGR